MSFDSHSERMYGRFDYTIDDKNRVILPQRFRQMLLPEFAIGQGPNQCIRLYPKRIWEMIAEKLISENVPDEFDTNLGILQRMHCNCDFIGIDGQHRLTVPRWLKDYAGLNEEEPVALVGMGARVEIWSKANLAAAQERCDESIVNAAKNERFQVAGRSTAAAPADL